MSEWTQLGLEDGDGCITEMIVAQRHINVRMRCGYKHAGIVTFTYEEALNLAINLPVVKRLVQWAKDAQQDMYYLTFDEKHDIIVNGVEALRPFEENK